MNWNEVEFCQPVNGCELTRQTLVEDIRMHLFSASPRFGEILLERYRRMDANKNILVNRETVGEWDQDGLTCSRDLLRPDVYLPVPSDLVGTTDEGVAQLMQIGKFGFDLPVWVKNSGDCTRRVMLLTQDPRRVTDDIGMVTLSSPFGLHSQQCRLSTNVVGGPMAHIVEMLCDEGSTVYLTDVIKFFADESGSRLIKGRKNTFIDFLNKEIEYFRPTHIITFGNISNACLIKAKALAQHSADVEEYFQGVQILQMMHISLRNMHLVERAVQAFENHFIENIHDFVCGGAYA